MIREMKDSGVEWIGEIPKDWELTKVKKIGEYINGYPFKSKDWGNNGLPIIRIQNLTDVNKPFNRFNGQIQDKYLISKGDYLISWSATLDVFKWEREDGYLNQHIFKAIPNLDVVDYFYFYWLAVCFMEEMNNDKHGSAMQHVTKDIFDNFEVVLPNKNEQQKIANLLNHKVQHVNSIIDNTKQTIEEFKKYKQSLITETVTMGLKPDAEMKDSGIKYIGEIPVNWEIRKIKYVLIPLERPVLKTDDVVTCFRDGEVTLRKNRREAGYTFSDTERGYQGVEVGDLVFHGMDAFAGAIGISDSRGKCSPVVHVCDSNENKRYYMYFLRALAFNDVYMALSDGVRIRSSDYRNWNKLAQILVALPPLEEQQKIADFLDAKCSHIDNLIEQKQKLIIELETYKKSLIYEYVTGKREVL
ncbi:restriction endonuclease subunit S [Bacillus sp. K6W]|uniref:restriction endonuclease subunit S n=1 Tax=Bacillus sp. K6W TaxID=2249215 RepID=UPI0013B396C4|nr:restriction endonuclease subunit S [Bacillus sp. K6W]